MGLFSKKYCDICGEQIRFLGNRKVEDGNMCKDCAEKLSTWFSDRRRTTVADIKSQLNAREANRALVSAFSPTRTFGSYCTVQLDDRTGQFVALRSGMSLKDNPDVLSLSQITGCEVDVSQSRLEQTYRNEEGKSVSYEPQRYTYSYSFSVKLSLDHPYIDDIRLQLNRSAVKLEAGMPVETKTLLGTIKTYTPNPPDVTKSEEYQQYLQQAEELRKALLGLDSEPAEEASAGQTPAEAPASVPAGWVVCPNCTAKYQPSGDGKCPYCAL